MRGNVGRFFERAGKTDIAEKGQLRGYLGRFERGRSDAGPGFVGNFRLELR